MSRWLVAILIGGLILLLGGIALASIPDSSGVIHGCVKNGTTGQREVRVIDTAFTTTCSSGWTEVTWNQTGPAGPTGATGPQGPAGPAGATGPAGPPGQQRYYAKSSTFTLPSGVGSSLGGAMDCDEGDIAVGGGYALQGTFSQNAGVIIEVFGVGMTGVLDSQLAFGFSNHDDLGPITIQVGLRCADLSPYRS